MPKLTIVANIKAQSNDPVGEDNLSVKLRADS